MATKAPLYKDGNGNEFSLDSAASVALAAADLDRRMAAVEERETAPGGGDEARVARLEAVLGNYFHNEFADYDASRAAV